MVQFDPASFPEGSGWTYTDYQVGGGGVQRERCHGPEFEGGTTMLTGSATSWMASWQRQLGLHRGAVPQWYFGCYNYAARCYYQTGRPSDDYSTSLCLDGYFQTGSARPLGAAE